MATYYIATTGNDTTGDGSSGNPWATLSKFVSSAASGDTCIVNDGTYTWGNQTFSGKDLTIQAATVGGAIFDGAAANIKWTIQSGTLSFSGIKFTNVIRTTTATGNTGPFMYEDSYADSCTFTNCYFYNITVYGDGNGVFDKSSTGATTHSITLAQCLIYDIDSTTGNSVIFGGRTFRGSRTIKNCVIYDDNATATDIPAIFNNFGAIYTLTITNTIISNQAGDTLNFAINGTNSGGTNTSTYNCYHNITGALSGTGDITSDPLFVDVANNNFNLRPTSPCIDAGVII